MGHCNRSVAMENQHALRESVRNLNEVTVRRGCSVRFQRKMAGGYRAKVCASSSPKCVHIFSCNEGDCLMDEVIHFIDRLSACG